MNRIPNGQNLFRVFVNVVSVLVVSEQIRTEPDTDAVNTTVDEILKREAATASRLGWQTIQPHQRNPIEEQLWLQKDTRRRLRTHSFPWPELAKQLPELKARRRDRRRHITSGVVVIETLYRNAGQVRWKSKGRTVRAKRERPISAKRSQEKAQLEHDVVSGDVLPIVSLKSEIVGSEDQPGEIESVWHREQAIQRRGAQPKDAIVPHGDQGSVTETKPNRFGDVKAVLRRSDKYCRLSHTCSSG
jgi:hypothetical protein